MIIAKNSNFERKITFELQKNEKGNLSIVQKNIDSMSQEDQQKLSAKISNNLLSGKKLSKSDLDFLQKTSPIMYKKALIVEMERKQTKRQLANCKSKKEVQDLQDRKMMQYLGEKKAIDKISMPKEKKEDAKQFVQMRQEAFKDEVKDFKESGAYKKLPEKTKKESIGYSEKNPKDEAKEIFLKIQMKNSEFDNISAKISDSETESESGTTQIHEENHALEAQNKRPQFNILA
jgi:hypothetical protein